MLEVLKPEMRRIGEVPDYDRRKSISSAVLVARFSPKVGHKWQRVYSCIR